MAEPEGRCELRGREVWYRQGGESFRIATIPEHLTTEEWLRLQEQQAADRG